MSFGAVDGMRKTTAFILAFACVPLSAALAQDEPVAPPVEAVAAEKSQALEPQAAPPGQPGKPVAPAPLVYENAQAGIRVTVPAGWRSYRGVRRHPEILTLFSRLPYESADTDNPKIVLIREPAGKKPADSVLAVAYRHAEVVRLMRNLKEKVANTILLEPPVQDQGRAYARLAYEITSIGKDKALDIARSREYVFRGNDGFYVLLCGAPPEVFEKHTADFKAAADSVVIK